MPTPIRVSKCYDYAILFIEVYCIFDTIEPKARVEVILGVRVVVRFKFVVVVEFVI